MEKLDQIETYIGIEDLVRELREKNVGIQRNEAEYTDKLRGEVNGIVENIEISLNKNEDIIHVNRMGRPGDINNSGYRIKTTCLRTDMIGTSIKLKKKGST